MSDGIPVEIHGVGKVYFPKGMTPEQIQSAIESDILPKAALSPKAMNPGEYDSSSPEYQAKYGAGGPSRTARVGRGAEDVAQGVTQRILQTFAGKPFRSGVSIQELRAAADEDPSLKGLSDEELRAKYEATDPAADYTTKVNNELELYNKGRALQSGGFDAYRLGGNIAATAPLALAGPAAATVPARAISGATQGALSGAAQFNPSGELSDTAKNTAIGAATGAVVAPAAGWIGDRLGDLTRKIAGWWAGRGAARAPEDIIKAVPELQGLPADAQRDLITEAQAQIQKTGALDAEQIARKANLLAQGVTPTKSMVTRNPADWTTERNLQKLSQSPDEQLAGVGQKLTELYQANDRALTSKLQSMSESLPAGSAEQQGMTVMRSLDDLAKASQKNVSALYEGVRAAKGDQLASDARALTSTLDDLRDNTYAEKLVSSVTNKLRRFGMLDAEGNLTNQTMTVTQAEELRKFVNRLPNDFGKQDIIRAIDSDVMAGTAGMEPSVQEGFVRLYRGEPANASMSGDRWFTRVKKAAEHYQGQAGKGSQVTYVDVPESELAQFRSTDPNHRFYNDVTSPYLLPEKIASGRQSLESAGDPFRVAREAAAKRFATLDNPATQRALNTLGELTQGKTAQNFIKSQVIDAPEQDVGSLLKTLDTLPKDQAAKARDAMQAGVLQHLQDKAVNPNSGQFSGAALNKVLKQIGKAKLTLIFGADKATQLEQLARAGVDATYQPAYSAVNNSNTAPMLLSLMQKARVVPGVPLVVTDNAEKLAARSGYQNQLAEALAAKAQQPLPPVSPAARDVANALVRAGAQAPPAALYQARQKPNRQRENRQ